MATRGANGGTAEFFKFLEEGLDEPGEFSPEPYYSPESDVLFFYARDVPSYAKRMNPLITLILATDDNSLVGIKIKSIKRIVEVLERIGNAIAVHVIDHKIKLGILIAIASVAPVEDPDLETYENDLEKFGNVEIDKSELAAAC